ncbi:molybdenum cofactor guanylyltransferase [Yeosuana marina]|uniref:molybdenum cofactor guanylyltransferase n=1 Tax=Yeosuana marina TaxID=1565536 RepID=UPI0014237CA4|nr:molybdenum cofactor guanylyltransferase [Yeosuana marina]
MIDKKDITGIILAGGKSSRMGTDKGFLKLNRKSFVEYSIEAMKPLVSQMMIVSNNADYDAFKLKRVEDVIKNSGPLAGIYSGLSHSKTDYNLVLSCDIPFIKTSILEMLINAQDGDADIVQILSDGKPMPLIALYKKRCETIFYNLLQNDERRLHVALNQCIVKNIELNPECDVFTTNINTPEELKEIEHVDKN